MRELLEGTKETSLLPDEWTLICPQAIIDTKQTETNCVSGQTWVKAKETQPKEHPPQPHFILEPTAFTHL